jgi:hypothetical protein
LFPVLLSATIACDAGHGLTALPAALANADEAIE